MPDSPVAILDIFLRCAAVGQLVLAAALMWRPPLTRERWALVPVIVCAAAYLLLTAPIPDAAYGYWRNLFLTLTDATGYAVWFAALVFLEDGFSPRRWPAAAKAALVAFALWYLYFFGVLAGQGLFHDINHAIVILVLAHVLYVAIWGRRDDLVDRRRRSRILIAIFISAYFILLALAEFADSRFKNAEFFSLCNAILFFVAILLLARHLLVSGGEPSLVRPDETPKEQEPAASAGQSAAPEFAEIKAKLDEFLKQGGYRQQELTIAALAQQLGVPEHRLRKLINNALGFRNFSAFLNSWRIREAQLLLQDRSHDTKPILTLALDLGYGSIGPFNRAFKAETGQTPTEYRTQFQNRP